MLLFPVNILKWPPVHTNDVVLNLCKNTIIFFSRVCQFIVLYYIHDDVIKHQTTGHDTSMIIMTNILLFYWIHNMVIYQGDIFDWGKNALPNGGNIFYLFFCLELRQPSNLQNCSLMNVHWDLNPYIKSCGFSLAQIIQ